MTSLLKVSASQSKARSKEGKETGQIWGTDELRPDFEHGARVIADEEKRRGVAGVVHGDYKLDNLVRPTAICSYCAESRSSTLPSPA